MDGAISKGQKGGSLEERKVGLVQTEEKELRVGKTAQAQHGERRNKTHVARPGERCAEASALPAEVRASPVDYSWSERAQRCLLWSGTPVGSVDHLYPQPWLWLQPSALLGNVQSLGKASRAAGGRGQSKQGTAEMAVTQEDQKF